MLIENVLGEPLTPEEMEIQVCVDVTNGTHIDTATNIFKGSLEPMNHSRFIYFATGYMFFMTLLFGLFFNTKLKRTMADEGDFDIEELESDDNSNLTKPNNMEVIVESDISKENKIERMADGIELGEINIKVKAKR